MKFFVSYASFTMATKLRRNVGTKLWRFGAESSQSGVYNGDENRFRRRIVTIGFRHDPVVAISSRHKKLRCLQWRRIRDEIQIFDQRVPPLVWFKFQLFKKISLKMLNEKKNDHVRLKLLNNFNSGSLWVRDSRKGCPDSITLYRINFTQKAIHHSIQHMWKPPVEKYEWPKNGQESGFWQ